MAKNSIMCWWFQRFLAALFPEHQMSKSKYLLGIHWMPKRQLESLFPCPSLSFSQSSSIKAKSRMCVWFAPFLQSLCPVYHISTSIFSPSLVDLRLSLPPISPASTLVHTTMISHLNYLKTLLKISPLLLARHNPLLTCSFVFINHIISLSCSKP